MTGSSVSRPASGQGQRKSASFHGRIPESSEAFPAIPRPESHPDLAGRRKLISGKHQHLIPNSQDNVSGRLTKLLLNVTVQRSLGHVHVVMSPENTVDDLIKAAINAYVKEGRRPLLSQVDPSCYELHYSQFSLESLDRGEKLMGLGSRNFFLCNKKPHPPNSSCSNEAENATKTPSGPWFKFLDFLRP